MGPSVEPDNLQNGTNNSRDLHDLREFGKELYEVAGQDARSREPQQDTQSGELFKATPLQLHSPHEPCATNAVAETVPWTEGPGNVSGAAWPGGLDLQ